MSSIQTSYVIFIFNRKEKLSKHLFLARTSRIDELSSDYSQRRSHSTTGIEDEKATRNGHIENDTYNVAPKAPSDAGSDTKKRSRSFVRPQIRSAVPNSQITTIAKRPSQSGRGTVFSSISFRFLISSSVSWSTN